MTLNDPQGQPYPERVQTLVRVLEQSSGPLGPIARQMLVDALEAVRAAVTINDLDMGEVDNVLYFDGASGQLAALAAELTYGTREAPWVRVAVDRGALKVKLGEQSWSPGVTSERPHGGYHKNEED